MTANIGPMDCIYLKVTECNKLFSQFRNDRIAINQYEKFKRWYLNIGAHKRGRSSLDRRLRDASHIRDVVIELLDGLKEVLVQGMLPKSFSNLWFVRSDTFSGHLID